MEKCPGCGREKKACVLCGEIDCPFCVPHFCEGDQSENLRKAIEEGKIKEFTEEDAKEFLKSTEQKTDVHVHIYKLVGKIEFDIKGVRDQQDGIRKAMELHAKLENEGEIEYEKPERDFIAMIPEEGEE